MTRREQILKALKAKKIPIYQMADDLGLSHGTAYKYLRGVTDTGSEIYFAILDYLKGRGTEKEIIKYIESLPDK